MGHGTEYMDSAEEQYLAPAYDEINEINKANTDEKEKFKAKIVWRNVMLFAILHCGALIGLYELFFHAKWASVLWTVLYSMIGGQGVTAGAHRLWTHKSYKANLAMRIVLMLCNCAAFQNDIIEWSRDHRCHHKWNDTDADPHNSKRGFFFSHMGWLLVRKHPEVKRKGATIDISDLLNDKVLMFQRKYYLLLVPIFCFLVPAAIPVYLWNESSFVAFMTCSMFRYCWTLHHTWLINSAAHKWGFKPYDEEISAVDSYSLALLTMGEGGHNFHHVFPQDYRTSEFINEYNISKSVIDAFATVGWAFDRKVVSNEAIEKQKARRHRKLG
ncbi:Acyl-CoA desaturase [Toxocara canis]|uniref:Acyl-CoA desaturase n=1 Tax=Toxocara canis TaxID=6265 RepID=A0A0B2V9V7_TOXCA|nr:Acyl-CoA desaturase [Toxocara canis]